MSEGRVVLDPAAHPDDNFHVPVDDDPWWTETCWFTFTVPERDLSAQLYPFFRPNQGVVAAGAYVWDPSGDQVWNCRYAKNFWHLPMPAQPLTDLTLPNGSRYRTLEPGRRYHVAYDDPDGDALHIDVTFTAVAAANFLGDSHFDQPGRFEGRFVLEGEELRVDSYGFRDRSWGPRAQFGEKLLGGFADRGGYSYATASEADAFHTITMDWGEGCRSIHGFLLRDGEWARLTDGRREVVEHNADGFPLRVRVTGTDERGRTLDAEGRCRNRLVFPINPNLVTVNCLVEWNFDGVVAFGEDHDNWSAAAIRHHCRAARAGPTSG